MEIRKLIPEVYGEQGYSLHLKLSEEELGAIRKMIRMQWLYRLQLIAPKYTYQFDELGIERYHELAHIMAHTQPGQKISGFFPKKALIFFRAMNFFKKIPWRK